MVSESGINIRSKRFAKYNFISAISFQLFGFILIKILTNTISSTQYGYYSIFVSLTVSITTLSTALFTNSIWRYTERYHILDQGNTIKNIWYMSIILSSLSIFIVILFTLIAKLFFSIKLVNINELDYIIILFSLGIYSFGTAVFTLVFALSKGLQDSKLIFSLFFSYSLLDMLIGGITAYVYRNFLPVISYLSIGKLTLAVSFSIIAFRKIGKGKFRIKDILLTVKFSFPLALRKLIISLIPTILFIASSFWIDYSATALIAVGISCITVFDFLISNLYSPFLQYSISRYENSRINGFNSSILPKRKLYIYILSTFWLIFLLIEILSPILILLISNEEFLVARNFLIFALLGRTIFWHGNITGGVCFYLKEKTSVDSIITMISFVIASILLFFFVPIFGIVGAGFVYLIFSSIYGISTYLIGTKIIETPFPHIDSVLILISVLMTVVSIYILSIVFPTLSYILLAPIAVILYIMMLILFNLLSFDDFNNIIKFLNLDRFLSKFSKN